MNLHRRIVHMANGGGSGRGKAPKRCCSLPGLPRPEAPTCACCSHGRLWSILAPQTSHQLRCKLLMSSAGCKRTNALPYLVRKREIPVMCRLDQTQCRCLRYRPLILHYPWWRLMCLGLYDYTLSVFGDSCLLLSASI